VFTPVNLKERKKIIFKRQGSGGGGPVLLDAIDKGLVDSVVLHTISLYGHLRTAMEPVESAPSPSVGSSGAEQQSSQSPPQLSHKHCSAINFRGRNLASPKKL